MDGEADETRLRAPRFGGPAPHARVHNRSGFGHACRPPILAPVLARAAESAPSFRAPGQ